mmetsp:Transcript_56320/g.163350  ORF Transcript_56320/g.163350 Transcript_56320/m.163350 type:complete len:297 (+) Transcript_56320:83-973(+)
MEGMPEAQVVTQDVVLCYTSVPPAWQDPSPAAAGAASSSASASPHSSDEHSDYEPVPPAIGVGKVWKYCGGAFRHWAKRYFVLKDGRFHWAHEDVPPERPADVTKRSCIDFSRSHCEVVENGKYRLTLLPQPGRRWNRHDVHGRAGTDEPMHLDFSLHGEPPAAGSWAALFREHIAYGQVSRRNRASKRRQRKLASLGLEDVPQGSPLSDCEEDGPATCPVCLEALGDDSTPVVRTPCQHCFHKDCMQEWVAHCSNCPLCRTALGEPTRRRRSLPPPPGHGRRARAAGMPRFGRGA